MPRSVPEDEARSAAPCIARIAVEGAPFHLGDALDYLVGDGPLTVGDRVEVSLAGRRTRGLVTALADRSDVPHARLRPVGRRLGDAPWVAPDDIGLLGWAAQRFGAPLGDVVRHALPNRVVDEERRATAAGWWPPAVAPDRPATGEGAGSPPDGGALAPDAWVPYGADGRALLDAVAHGQGSFLLSPLPGDDLAAVIADLARRCLDGGRDVLLVVPGPVSAVADAVLGLVPEEARVDLRGGPTPRMTYRRWLRARAGLARVVVGERSAAFVPLARLGLAVVVDEADPTHKERRSPRHHVREVLLERARRSRGVGLCTADVPSAVTTALVSAGRLTWVAPDRDAVAERRPDVRLEVGDLEARARISRAGLRALRDAVRDGGYGVLLAARRGEGRALACARCGDLVRCHGCSASIARSPEGGWWCAACGTRSSRAPRCERCGPGPLSPLAAGAERLGEELARTIDAPVVVLEGHAPPVPPPPAVLVMTRGSVLDRPPPGGPVLGVVLPDVDGALRRPTLDAAEDALRLAFRVAGWAEQGAPVVVETREPEHHALRALRERDAAAFWEEETALRAPVGLPPCRRAIRVETRALEEVARRLPAHVAAGDVVVGPLPLDEGRGALLVLLDDRAATLEALRPLRDDLSRRGVELRIEVDPVDLG